MPDTLFNNTCIVNVSTDAYVKGQKRLKDSLRNCRYSGDYLFWTDCFPSGSPTQAESPWGFKIFAILDAYKKGYSNILWLDANMICVRPINPILQKIRKDGYFIFSAGTTEFGQWCSDIALKNFNINLCLFFFQ